jgi:hypothetical protein
MTMTPSTTLPRLENAAVRRLRMPKSDTGLLPLRVPSKEHRAANGLLSSLADVHPGQTAFAIVVVRGVAERRKEAFGRDQVEQVHVGARLARGALRTFIYLGATSLDLIAATCGWRPQLRARVSSLFESTPSKEGFERKYDNQLAAKISDKATRQLFTGSLYVGVIDECGRSATGFADHLANELSGASVPEEAVTTTRLETMPVRDARPAIVVAPPRFDDARLLFTADELAALFHAPDAKTDTRGLAYPATNVPLLPPPTWMKRGWEPGYIRIGEAMPGTSEASVVSMPLRDLMTTYVTGKSNYGKSSWLQGVLRDVCLSDFGAAISIDPNVSLNENTLRLLARDHPEVLESNRVLHLLWTSRDHPVYWNPLAVRDEAEVALAVKTVLVLVSAFNVGSLDALTQGKGYLTAAARNLALANLAIYRTAIAEGRDPENIHRLTPFDLRRYFTVSDGVDALSLHDSVLRFADADILLRFRDLADPKDKRATFKSLVHRLDTMTNSEVAKYLVDSPFNRVDWKRWISQDYTVLNSLSVLDADSEVSVGMLPTLQAQYFFEAQDLWVRLGRPEQNDPRFREALSVAVTDEVQNLAEVAGLELARCLEMLRKVGIRAVFASQFESQMESGGKRLRDNLRSNVAHRISFHIPASQSTGLEAAAIDRDRGIVTKAMLSSLPKYHLLATVELTRQDGRAELPPPFVAKSVYDPLPAEGDPDFERVLALQEALERRTREAYCRPLAVAEQERLDHERLVLEELERAARHFGLAAGSSAGASRAFAEPGRSLSSHAGAGIDVDQGVGERRIDELFGEPPAEI